MPMIMKEIQRHISPTTVREMQDWLSNFEPWEEVIIVKRTGTANSPVDKFKRPVRLDIGGATDPARAIIRVE